MELYNKANYISMLLFIIKVYNLGIAHNVMCLTNSQVVLIICDEFQCNHNVSTTTSSVTDCEHEFLKKKKKKKKTLY